MEQGNGGKDTCMVVIKMSWTKKEQEQIDCFEEVLSHRLSFSDVKRHWDLDTSSYYIPLKDGSISPVFFFSTSPLLRMRISSLCMEFYS